MLYSDNLIVLSQNCPILSVYTLLSSVISFIDRLIWQKVKYEAMESQKTDDSSTLFYLVFCLHPEHRLKQPGFCFGGFNF